MNLIRSERVQLRVFLLLVLSASHHTFLAKLSSELDNDGSENIFNGSLDLPILTYRDVPLLKSNDVAEEKPLSQDYREPPKIIRIRQVTVEPSKHEPSLGESWNITCRAEIDDNYSSEVASPDFNWFSEDGKIPSDENVQSNSYTTVNNRSVTVETFLRINRVLPNHNKVYECKLTYKGFQMSKNYKLKIKYDNIKDFQCVNKDECPENMDCDLNRKCVCDSSNHPILINTLTDSTIDRICYPVAELGYFCHSSAQCEKSTINSECVRNICQCQKGYAMTSKMMMNSGSTQFACELHETISGDRNSAYRGIMIASGCFGVVFLLVIAAFPIRKTCSKCSLRRRYVIDSRRTAMMNTARSQRSLNSIVSRASSHIVQFNEKPPPYDDVVRDRRPSMEHEDAPPSYESLEFNSCDDLAAVGTDVLSSPDVFFMRSYPTIEQLSEESSRPQDYLTVRSEPGGAAAFSPTLPVLHSTPVHNT